MKLNQATEIAERIKNELAPFCDRIEIAGSIRRRKPEVGDIEIVAIPKRVEEGMLFSNIVTHPKFCILVNRWPAIKGKATGKYTQRILPEGIKLDLFMADADNWGLIFAIRTGSAAYSHHVLANAWCRAGYHSMSGHLVKGFHKIPVREERDLFDLIGISWAEPWERNL
jgi:DNA polymerase/3'-5' exonuclease PolX